MTSMSEGKDDSSAWLDCLFITSILLEITNQSFISPFHVTETHKPQL